MKAHWCSFILVLVLVLTGCGQGGNPSPMQPQVPPSLGEPIVPPGNATPNPIRPIEVSPLSTPLPDSPPEGETTSMPNPSDPNLQKLIETASEDLAKRFAVPLNQIQFKEATEVIWSDSSLGCPNPASSHIQVLTPGYLIRLQAFNRIFEYHTDKRGSVIYCENPSPLPLDSLPDQ